MHTTNRTRKTLAGTLLYFICGCWSVGYPGPGANDETAGSQTASSTDSGTASQLPTTTDTPTTTTDATDDTTTTDTTDTTTNPATSVTTDTPDSTSATTNTTEASTSTTDTDTDTDTDPFLPSADANPSCNTYAENCPDGQKCMPYSNGGPWNDFKCVDVTGDGQAGDPCTVEESQVSGIDDCALHHICWDVDIETSEGTCVAFCDGSSDDPSCGDVNTACLIAYDEYINLCLPTCDALLQNCPNNEGCFPHNNTFTCELVAVADDNGLEGDPCEYVNACQKGLMCAMGSMVPNCTEDGCCTPMCDLDDNPDPCENNKECLPIYPQNESIRVGFCGLIP